MEYGCKLKKNKFIVIMGSDEDWKQNDPDSFTVKCCDRYIYLGVIFTTDGGALTSLKLYVEQSEKLILMYIYIYTYIFASHYAQIQTFQACLLIYYTDIKLHSKCC